MAQRITPQQKLDEIRQLRKLGYYAELESAKLDAKQATSEARASLAWADKLATARRILNASDEEKSILLLASEEESKLQYKAPEAPKAPEAKAAPKAPKAPEAPKANIQ